MKLFGKKNPTCPKCKTLMAMDYSLKYQRLYYYCPNRNCDIMISAHPKGDPVGIPADKMVREMRQYAHKLATKIWKYEDFNQRKKMYEWMEKHTIAKHIGKMEAEELGNTITKFKNIITKYNLN